MKKLLFLIITIAPGWLCAGGGWTHPQGHGYWKLSQNMIRADQIFGPDGALNDIVTTSLYTTSVYGEYGLTDRLTGIAYLPFFVRSTFNEIVFRQSGRSNPGDEVNAVGDIDISLKYGLIRDKAFVLSASLMLGLPTGEVEGGEGMILQTGDGEFNQMLRFDVSHSFYPRPFYVSAMAGFNNRTRGFSDEFRYGLEGGYQWGKKLLTVLKMNGISSFFNGHVDPTQGNGLFANNIEYLTFMLEANYFFTERLGITGSVAGAFFGRYVLAAPNYSAGVFYTW